jgi:hypothetical protein
MKRIELLSVEAEKNEFGDDTPESGTLKKNKKHQNDKKSGFKSILEVDED